MASRNSRGPTRYNVHQTLAKHRQALTKLITQSPAPLNAVNVVLDTMHAALDCIPNLYPVKSEDAFKESFILRWRAAKSLPDYNEEEWCIAARLLKAEE